MEMLQVEDVLPEVSSLPLSDRFFARQPIFDSKARLYAYELLFRSGKENSFHGDSDAATRVMLDNFLLFGADTMTGSFKAFINCTREVLVDDLVSLFPPHSMVLEVLENIEPDDAVVTACQKLKRLGYQIALDDYVPRRGMESLIAIADYIKVDFRLCDASIRRVIRQQIHGSKARLVAEKIEDLQEFQLACSEGYDLFQGYFFARPEVLSKRGLSGDALHYLNLFAALNHTPLNWANVEKLVKCCPSLTYRLLRVINSGLSLHFRLRKGGGLTNEAIIVLHRALFCELLAPRIRQSPEEQYLFGLLSLFPLLLGVSVEQLVEHVPLRHSVRAALLGEKNEISRSVELLQRYETEKWADSIIKKICPGVTHEDVARVYLASLHEVQEFL